MAPGAYNRNHVMTVNPMKTKGSRMYYTTSTSTQHPDIEDMSDMITTVKEITTSTIRAISSTFSDFMPELPGPTENTNTVFQPGPDENMNNTNIIPANEDTTFIETNPIATSTGTSFELITTTLMDGMNMEHTDEMESNSYILFIVLGVILGVLIIAALVLGVIYNHYRKRGFQEISGEQSCEPQSMKKIQQASSHDALLDK